jgi:hypothetical protein
MDGDINSSLTDVGTDCSLTDGGFDDSVTDGVLGCSNGVEFVWFRVVGSYIVLRDLFKYNLSSRPSHYLPIPIT